MEHYRPCVSFLMVHLVGTTGNGVDKSAVAIALSIPMRFEHPARAAWMSKHRVLISFPVLPQVLWTERGRGACCTPGDQLRPTAARQRTRLWSTRRYRDLRWGRRTRQRIISAEAARAEISTRLAASRDRLSRGFTAAIPALTTNGHPVDHRPGTLHPTCPVSMAKRSPTRSMH